MNKNRLYITVIIIIIFFGLIHFMYKPNKIEYTKTNINLIKHVKDIVYYVPEQGELEIKSMGLFNVSAYTANDTGMNGKGITATGTKVTQYRTVASDWSIIPPGTQLLIEGFDCVFVVEDKGGAIKGNKLDIYMDKRKDALNFGRQNLNVYMLEEEDCE